MFLSLRRDSLWIPIILLILLVGCWSELDLYAPSFPQMMHHFATTEQMMQWTLSLNFFGFFFASLLCGPLADAFGRRIVILAGSAFFVLGSMLCVYAPTIEWMLLGRLVQGLGVSAPITVSMAVIADIYHGERQVRLLTRLNSTITITMALAPIVGVYLTDHLGWRSNFIAIFAIALLGSVLIFMFLPETHEKELRNPFKAASLISGYITLLKSKHFMYAALGMCFSITPYFILIGILPLLFMESLAVSINSYALYQGSIVGLFALISLSAPALLSRISLKKVVSVSVIMSWSALAIACVISLVVKDNPLFITTLMWIYVCGQVLPPTMMFSNAMDMYPELRACASSLIQSLRMLSMSIGTAIAGIFYDGSFFPIALVMFIFVALSVPLTMMVFKHSKATLSSDGLPAMH